MLTIATFVLASAMSYNVDIGSTDETRARELPPPAPPVAGEIEDTADGSNIEFLGPPAYEKK
ncbi:MAG TPA: hypothetical protein VF546_05715 [Pyrinomonadaceae bacterium]